jgi:hypothetical protein
MLPFQTIARKSLLLVCVPVPIKDWSYHNVLATSSQFYQHMAPSQPATPHCAQASGSVTDSFGLENLQIFSLLIVHRVISLFIIVYFIFGLYWFLVLLYIFFKCLLTIQNLYSYSSFLIFQV